jgi:hypothetical protein
MGDRRRDAVTQLQPHGALPHSLNGSRPLTAAAQLTSSVDIQRPLQYESWQDEVWSFYENLGEFNYGVEWFGEALSRVRLTAAMITPGGDEPEIIDSGPVADLITNLVGGTDGQAQMLRSLGVQLSVPGDAYFVGREVSEVDMMSGVLLDAEPDMYNRVWTVQPVNTIRRSNRLLKAMLGRNRRSYEIQVEDALWSPLPNESLVCRIWDRNEHFPWRAMSPAKAALPIMREIDMYNRYIIATLVSRVALNGIMMIPDEVTFPVNPMYEDSADPFIAEMIDIMRSAIKNPGSPAAAAPMPMRIPAEMIEKFKHFTFATPLDQRIFEHREQALRRLATTLNLPAEIVTGMGDVNHWSGWQLSEDAIKIHVSPKVEIITRCLTMGYLHPMLKALGEDITGPNGERIIVWYDTSELTQRPDRSAAAMELRKMMVINDSAARRETGFDEADAPTDDELEKMVLMQLAINPQTAIPALKELTGLELEMPPPPPVVGVDPSAGGPVGVEEQSASTTGTQKEQPDTQGDAPPAPDESATTASARRDTLVRQTHSPHRRARESIARR